MAAMAGGSVSRAASPMRPKFVILLEIMIIVINFNNADLLYYLLLDAFARRLRVWCTMVAVEQRRPPCESEPTRASFFPQSVCVFCGKTLKPFFRRVASTLAPFSKIDPLIVVPFRVECGSLQVVVNYVLLVYWELAVFVSRHTRPTLAQSTPRQDN
jgi:hypothetical protein